MSFDILGLPPEILSAVTDAGYSEATPIQAQAIPKVMEGCDILGIAQTGTGKTASFTLPMITILSRGRARARMPRSLILCPTRELAAQVAENFETYGKNSKLSMALLIGGVSFADQETKLMRGVDVLIATPGRLLDHFERGKVLLTGVQVMVIDEADRMLDMGFIPDVERICKLTPFHRQTLFFSATMPPEIQRLSDAFLQNPVRIEVARISSATETVSQALISTHVQGKRDALIDVMKTEELKNAIVFCNRKRDIGPLASALKKAGFNAAPLHGDLDQSVRTRTLDSFRAEDIKVLVASDVAARGLDIPEVSHVFNYDVPIHSEDYIHRIGRTGRAGREGRAFTISTLGDRKYVAAIENLLGREIPKAGGDQTPVKADKVEEKKNSNKPEDKIREKSDNSLKNSRSSKLGKKENAPEPAVVREKKPRREDRKGPAKSDTKNSRQRESGKSVLGLGDHVPAFMLRPVRPGSAEN